VPMRSRLPSPRSVRCAAGMEAGSAQQQVGADRASPCDPHHNERYSWPRGCHKTTVRARVAGRLRRILQSQTGARARVDVRIRRTEPRRAKGNGAWTGERCVDAL
jgi:hypothetical protein